VKKINLYVLLGCTSLLMACPQKDKQISDSGDSAGPQNIIVDGGGYSCLMDDGNDDTSTGLIGVVLDDCLSGCAYDLTADCEASVVDGRIEVSAWGEYSLPGGNPPCMSVCIELVAECEVSGLDESVTQLNYGDDTVDIDFPASEQTCTHLDD
jgi:hypothetical protein